MSEQLWAVVADIYSPLLVFAMTRVLLKRRQSLRESLILITLYMAGVYGIMWLDSSREVWSHIGMDYSTHSAFAMVSVGFLWRNTRAEGWRCLQAASLFAYFGLMRYLDYHTFADMASTAVVIAVWILICNRLVKALAQAKSGNSDSNQTQGSGRNRGSHRPP